jgi:putative mRNA 3-end processing factor
MGATILRMRVDTVDSKAHIIAQPFGKPLNVNGVHVSLHPAGHMLGSAQVRVEHQGEVWVVSGDYKTEADITCEPFELVRCHTFISESTFGLPIYRWRPQAEIFSEINQWWLQNQAQGRTSILFAYSVGKAQRILAGVDDSIGPILTHGAVQRFVHAYRRADITQPNTQYADTDAARLHRGQALVVAPPSAASSAGWLRKFGPTSLAFASGWMQIRGARRRRAMDRGFVLSDHADWQGLLSTIYATGAQRIGVTHGYTNVMVRYLQEKGLEAFIMPTRFEGESVGESMGAQDDQSDQIENEDSTAKDLLAETPVTTGLDSSSFSQLDPEQE